MMRFPAKSTINVLADMETFLRRWGDEHPQWSEGDLLIAGYRTVANLNALIWRGDILVTKPPGYPAIVIAYETEGDLWRVAVFDNEGRQITEQGRWEEAEDILSYFEAAKVAPVWAICEQTYYALKSLSYPAPDWIPNALLLLAAHGRCLKDR